MKITLVLLLIGTFFATVHAQCAAFPDDLKDHVCEFDQDAIHVEGESSCRTINNDPFVTLSQTCYNYMLEDGRDCSHAIARYFCSFGCQNCGGGTLDPPCDDLCTDAAEECPLMWANNCDVADRCTVSNLCTRTDVDKGKVNDLTDDHDEDDGDSDDGDGSAAPGKPSYTFGVFLSGILAFAVATLVVSK